MSIVKFFRGAGATGNVFFLSGGKATNKGLAYSGFVWPWETVAVIPTTAQVLDFEVDARTADKQSATVTGNIKVTFDPTVAISKFDFTVNKDGSYLCQWEEALRAFVVEQVFAPIREKAKSLGVEVAIQSHSDFEQAVTESMANVSNPLADLGIKFESCSIAKVECDDDEVEEAIGSKERQEMLVGSDRAMHERRLKGVQNDRAIKKFEAGTKLALEKEQSAILDEQAKNKEKEAKADAKATEIRLAPLKEVDSGKLLGAAIMEAAKTGRMGSLSITSEFLAAVGQK